MPTSSVAKFRGGRVGLVVVLALTAGNRDFHLGTAVHEVQLERHDGVAGFLYLAGDLDELLAVQQQLAPAACSVVGPAALVVLRDVDGFHPQLVVIERAESVHHGGVPLAQGLHFGAHQRDAGLVGVQHVIVMPGLAIGGHHLTATFFRHGETPQVQVGCSVPAARSYTSLRQGQHAPRAVPWGQPRRR